MAHRSNRSLAVTRYLVRGMVGPNGVVTFWNSAAGHYVTVKEDGSFTTARPQYVNGKPIMNLRDKADVMAERAKASWNSFLDQKEPFDE